MYMAMVQAIWCSMGHVSKWSLSLRACTFTSQSAKLSLTFCRKSRPRRTRRCGKLTSLHGCMRLSACVYHLHMYILTFCAYTTLVCIHCLVNACIAFAREHFCTTWQQAKGVATCGSITELHCISTSFACRNRCIACLAETELCEGVTCCAL